MQDHATLLPALAPCEPIPRTSENEEMRRELSRLLAELGMPVEEPQNAPAANDKFPELEPAAEERFVQQSQVCEAPGDEECLVALPTPSSTPSNDLNKALLEALGNEDFAGAAALLGIPEIPVGVTKREPTFFDKIRSGEIKVGGSVTVTVAGGGGTTTSKTKQKAPANIDKRSWSRLSEAARLHAAALYCEEAGGMAVSLNLHPDKHDRWTSGTLKTKITELFQAALNRELKAAGIIALPYKLAFEFSPDGRLHLHGVLDTHDRDQAQIEAIKLALRKAAGQIKGKAAGTQLKLKEITDGPGWAAYINKARKQALTQLGLKCICVTSQAMSGLAGDHHNNLRRLRRAA